MSSSPAAPYRVGTFFDGALIATTGFRSTVRHCHAQLPGHDVLAVGRNLLHVSVNERVVAQNTRLLCATVFKSLQAWLAIVPFSETQKELYWLQG